MGGIRKEEDEESHFSLSLVTGWEVGNFRLENQGGTFGSSLYFFKYF